MGCAQALASIMNGCVGVIAEVSYPFLNFHLQLYLSCILCYVVQCRLEAAFSRKKTVKKCKETRIEIDDILVNCEIIYISIEGYLFTGMALGEGQGPHSEVSSPTSEEVFGCYWSKLCQNSVSKQHFLAILAPPP